MTQRREGPEQREALVVVVAEAVSVVPLEVEVGAVEAVAVAGLRLPRKPRP